MAAWSPLRRVRVTGSPWGWPCAAGCQCVQACSIYTCPTRIYPCPTRIYTCPTRIYTCPTRIYTCPTVSDEESYPLLCPKACLKRSRSECWPPARDAGPGVLRWRAAGAAAARTNLGQPWPLAGSDALQRLLDRVGYFLDDEYEDPSGQ